MGVDYWNCIKCEKIYNDCGFCRYWCKCDYEGDPICEYCYNDMKKKYGICHLDEDNDKYIDIDFKQEEERNEKGYLKYSPNLKQCYRCDPEMLKKKEKDKIKDIIEFMTKCKPDTYTLITSKIKKIRKNMITKTTKKFKFDNI